MITPCHSRASSGSSLTKQSTTPRGFRKGCGLKKRNKILNLFFVCVSVCLCVLGIRLGMWTTIFHRSWTAYVHVIKAGHPWLCFATHLDTGLFLCIYFTCAFTLLVRAIYWAMFLLPLAYKSWCCWIQKSYQQACIESHCLAWGFCACLSIRFLHTATINKVSANTLISRQVPIDNTR